MGCASTSTSGSGLFGFVSPRTATLAIAILGIVIHLNTYSWLGALTASFPDVPERALRQRPPSPPEAFVPSPDRFSNSAAKAAQLDAAEALARIATSADATTTKAAAAAAHLPEWVAEAKAYLKAQGVNYNPHPGTDAGKDSNSPATGETDAALNFQALDDGAEDVERMQWDALRLVIGTLRWYILLSVVCCCAGVVGVLRSQLLLSRMFVIHSFLDFLLSTLSLLALAIVCTYPSVRAHVCDEFGSGDLQAWFSHTTSPGLHGRTRGHPTHDPSPLPNSAPGGSGAIASDVTVVASGWETWLDGIFASENCEESFRTTLVPLLMIFGLVFTAVRLQCFFLVQRFYTTLLRSKVYQYGYAAAKMESASSTPMAQMGEQQQVRGGERRWKESKLLD